MDLNYLAKNQIESKQKDSLSNYEQLIQFLFLFYKKTIVNSCFAFIFHKIVKISMTSYRLRDFIGGKNVC